MTIKTYAKSIQGDRDHMEDYFYLDTKQIDEGVVFGGVYDGHGGYRAAEYTSQNLHRYFFEALENHHPLEAFILAYKIGSDQLTPEMAGTCALNLYVSGNELFYANAGDGKIIVIASNEVHQLSTEHRVISEWERKRVLDCGGSIKGPYVFTADYRGLKVTRSLGDAHHKPLGVIAEPSVGIWNIGSDDGYIVMGTDGLFDTLDNDTVANIARSCRPGEDIAEKLVSEALQAGSRDNISAVVLDLNGLLTVTKQ